MNNLDLFANHPAIKAREDRAPQPRTMPPIPDTGWKAPTSFPRLDAANLICIDCETFDPDLLTHGPGWGRGVGHIVGIAVGTDDGQRWYFPMRHTVGEGNLPPEAVLQWCRDEFSRAHQPKVFTNSQYDLGWLLQEGVTVAGDTIDVQIAEPLLDEHAHSYSLDTLAKKYLGEGKVDDALYAWCHRAYGGKEGRPQAGNIWRAPPCLVGPYAEGDVDLPLRIWTYQKALLEEQGLMGLFEIEAVLPRILVQMRMRGVKIDLAGAEQVKERLESSSKTAQERAGAICGCAVDIWASSSVANALNRCSIDFPKTAKGAPSFTSEWLDHHPSEITSLIRAARRYSKAASTFVDGYIINKQINGRVHGSFHQLRSERGGTIVGRFSSCLPDTEIITTHRGDIPLAEVQIGDLVWTHKQQWRAVKNKWFTGDSKTYKITLQNSRTVTCTSNHRILTTAGWLSLEDMQNEFTRTGFTQPTKTQGNTRYVSSSGKTNRDADRDALQDVISNSISHFAGMSPRRSLQGRKGFALFKEQERRGASDEGKVPGSAPQLQRRDFRWKRVFDDIAPSMVHWWREAQACFSASCDHVRSVARNQTTFKICGASYQWGQDRQSHIKSCNAVGYGARGTSPSYSVIKSVEYVGIAPVYDLEIETDHCFLAGGIFVHNSDPNLENIPARDEEIGPMIRSLWLPEDSERWTVYDFSQIQFRIMTHYAIGPGAAEARAKYHADPKTDYHNMAQALIQETTGVHLDRKPVKNINFGLAFTMGVDKLAAGMGITVEAARPLIDAYHAGLPFVRATSDKIAAVGQHRGYIKGILGRRHRFDYWEPREWKKRGEHKLTKDRDALEAQVGRVVRAFTHLGLNRLAQDGEGSHVKKGIVDCYKAGIFDVIGAPLNIVHDDVNFSTNGSPEHEEALLEAKRLMEGAIKWHVPMIIERADGDNWGAVK